MVVSYQMLYRQEGTTYQSLSQNLVWMLQEDVDTGPKTHELENVSPHDRCRCRRDSSSPLYL